MPTPTECAQEDGRVDDEDRREPDHRAHELRHTPSFDLIERLEHVDDLGHDQIRREDLVRRREERARSTRLRRRVASQMPGSGPRHL
jgi:hypothetical protein